MATGKSSSTNNTKQQAHHPHLPKKKKGTPPPVDRLLLPAIGVALAIVAYKFITGLGGGIARVSVLDEAALRTVVYGESPDTPHAVLCHAEDSTAPLSSVFQDAHKEAASPAVFRVVDCEAVLPTEGKSIAELLGLNLKQRPTIFVSGGSVGTKPVQVPEKQLKTGHHLTQYLRAKLEKRAVKIETTQDLRTKCLDKPVCGLLLKGGKKAPTALKDAMNTLLKEYPDVTFASVDASVLYVLHLEEYLAEFQKDQARFVVFKKVSGGQGAKEGRLISSMVASEFVTYGPMSNTVAAVLQNTATMQKLPSLPQVKTRTKKLEESEKAKRQRKAEQKRRQAQGSGSSSSSSSSSGGDAGSDDMKEERRRERERRRAEHYAPNNVKPKTPEELAEMERKRRARMEEEAAKWNMAPDDAPPEGEYTMDGEDGNGGGYMFEDEEDDYDQVTVEEVDENQQDDEDVIDLD